MKAPKYGMLWMDIPFAHAGGEAIELFKLGLANEDKKKSKYLIPNPVNQVILKDFPNLEIISTPSTGTNHIDLKKCEKRGIKVLSLLDDRESLNEIYASSEFALYMILEGLRNGGFRQWKSYDRNYDFMLGNEIYGKKVGVVGFGRIGQNVARYVSAMGATWKSYDYGSAESTLLNMFEESDIILLSPTLNEKSRGMITKEHLSRLGEDAILVNVARAEIINEDDLISYATKGMRYVTDVLHREVAGNVSSPLLSLPNVIVHPHIAGHTWESTSKAVKIAVNLLEREITKKK